MDIHALLQELGFTEYEARAYVALVGSGSGNGYAVAKAAGMPRANVYAVLERLVERGAAQRLDSPKGTHYQAVAPARLTRRLERRHRRALTAARKALASLGENDGSAPVFNVRGYDELITQARSAIDEARSELLIGIQPAEAGALADALREARERGVLITTLCMESCPTECGGCQGRIHRYQLAPAGDRRWLLVVSDAQFALAGETGATSAAGIVTRQPHIVELTAAYIRQSLALATLADDFGDRFDGLLSAHAREILDALHPDEGFIEHLSRILGARPQ